MSRSKIGWCDYTLNPVKGLCPVGCSFCYARRLYHRFKWDPEIRCDADWMMPLYKLKQPSRVFVGSTMELFGDWMKSWWLEHILLWTAQFPQHTFIFLTKLPENLPREWPDNCWVGVTATEAFPANTPGNYLKHIQATVKFISFEPLLHWPDGGTSLLTEALELPGINWLIIGQQTPIRKSTMPKVAWVQEIVQAADRAGVSVFLKDNLKGLLPEAHPFYTFPWESDPEAGASVLRQEFPKVKAHAQ